MKRVGDRKGSRCAGCDSAGLYGASTVQKLSDAKIGLCHIRFASEAVPCHLGCVAEHGLAEVLLTRILAFVFVSFHARPLYTYAVDQRSRVGDFITS